ncbi:penicillin-binding protein 1A [Desulfospira joergensenii]|uniref:penicillin-binding protein 1A n=1 Tax=Desulfospira joergensenii TaxID=53329 RepID=UPI0003B32701|nr:penicillin-binding protein 1A [Desulfospira joergensenii]
MTKVKPGVIVLLVAGGLLAGLLLGTFFGLVHDLPEINRLKQFKPPSVTTLYSRNNQVISRFFLEQRFPVSLEEVSPFLITALITTEDRGFYTHSGINLKAILRALIHDLKAGGFKQGASTLTQQLAKTLFLSSEKSLVRKIREAILALQIERRYTKDEILELYLNQIYLGSGSYGVEAAARTYFNRSADSLTLGQAAMLAGLPKAPSAYSPLNNPKLARKRRAVVLKQMLLLDKISRSEYEAGDKEPVLSGDSDPGADRAPYFTQFVRSELENQIDLKGLYSRGAGIRTTLDLNLQKIAEGSVDKHMAALEARMTRKGLDPSFLECALVALDVKTGAVLAMIGGRDFKRSRFNRAVQARRQPGSAFKPFVFAAALEQGFSQAHTLADAPLSLDLDNNTAWKVKNFSGTFSGEMTLRKALALSKNTPAVRLIREISPRSVVDLALRAGIVSPLKPYPSLALGSFEVTLLELTRAYIPFANKGIRVQSFAIDRIEDLDGRILFQTQEQKQPAMSRKDAAVMADMLKAVITEGTGKKALEIKKDIAGKTGTTDDFRDALFIGFSPGTALGVWVGNDDSSTLGRYETGAKAALPIWIDTMKAVLENQPLQYFDIPDRTKMVYINPGNGKITGPEKSDSVRALLRTEDLQ